MVQSIQNHATKRVHATAQKLKGSKIEKCAEMLERFGKNRIDYKVEHLLAREMQKLNVQTILQDWIET